MQSTSIQDFQQQQKEEISKIHRPGVVANFIYKVVELGTFTYAFVTDAINILTGQKSIFLFFLLFFTLNFFQYILLYTKMFFKKYQQRQEEISKICRPGVVANFIYKVVELGTFTYAFVTDANNILTGSHSVSTWGENVETVEDEELPPPYDNSWSMPSTTTTTTTFATTNTTTTETKPSLAISTPPSQQKDYPTTQTETRPSLIISRQDHPTIQTSRKITPTHSPTNSTSRRRQFRVRRGRRFIRRKSSSVEHMSNNVNNTNTHYDNNVDDDENIILKELTDTHSDSNVDDDDDIIYKRINCKISNMIAEVTAALNSKAEVTEVDMILAEEKEREERIMKEFGIRKTPISRRARTNFIVHNYNYSTYNYNYNNSNSNYNNYNNNYNNNHN
ncbi:unnamed protein product [Rhizophagus irregularis]|nr:unnamed protein product [Rhizophagus irregularis]CAB5297845.1 unnamed protein product [Rhizophagus irregularis]